MNLNDLEVTGRSRAHVVQLEEPRFAAQLDVANAFLKMRLAAATDGFDLHPVSSFRDYRMQSRIWNRKFSGQAPLYDRDGHPLDRSQLRTSEEIIAAILHWSALPGGSRHHWGTEIDVVDRGAVVPDGYTPRLLPEEISPGGPYRPLHAWLDQNMARFGFFRPYNYDLGGMFPEPWHLSYAPASVPALACLPFDLLTDVLQNSELLGKDTIVALLPQIYQTHILRIVNPHEQRPIVAENAPFKSRLIVRS